MVARFSLDGIIPNSEFVNHFKSHYNSIRTFTNVKIGKLLNTISSRDAFTGPSAYIDMIHSLQLINTGADISFVAPLSFNVTIEPKELNYQDMFSIYPYENQLYVINLTGDEVKNYLEFSYSKWINKMPSKTGHLLQINPEGKGERGKFMNAFFNFDSAAGVIYDVDTRKGDGERINIVSMADGKTFELNKTYSVALSSYRANGGGDLLISGCNLNKDEIEKRVIKKMGDIREILYDQIKRDGFIKAVPLYQWKFIPVKSSSVYLENDLKLLF